MLAIHLGPAGGWVASARDDQTLIVWDVRKGASTGVALEHEEGILDATFSPDGHALATIGATGRVQVWDCGTGKSRMLAQENQKRVDQVAFTADNSLLIQDADSVRRLWDLSAGGLVNPRILGDANITSFVRSDEARRLMTVNAVQKAQMWNRITGQTAGPPLTLETGARPTAISGEGRRVAVLGPNGDVRVWDSAGHWLPGSVRSHETVPHVAFAPRGRPVAHRGSRAELSLVAIDDR